MTTANDVMRGSGRPQPVCPPIPLTATELAASGRQLRIAGSRVYRPSPLAQHPTAQRSEATSRNHRAQALAGLRNSWWRGS